MSSEEDCVATKTDSLESKTSHIFLGVDPVTSVFLKLVHPLAKSLGARWVWNRGSRYRVYMKLDPVKVAWVVAQKERDSRNSTIAASMEVSVRRVLSQST